MAIKKQTPIETVMRLREAKNIHHLLTINLDDVIELSTRLSKLLTLCEEKEVQVNYRDFEDTWEKCRENLLDSCEEFERYENLEIASTKEYFERIKNLSDKFSRILMDENWSYEDYINDRTKEYYEKLNVLGQDFQDPILSAMSNTDLKIKELAENLESLLLGGNIQ